MLLPYEKIGRCTNSLQKSTNSKYYQEMRREASSTIAAVTAAKNVPTSIKLKYKK